MAEQERDTEMERFETECVHRVYDAIAPHFSHTRNSPWPSVSEFLQNLDDGSIVADVGCGNGKYMKCNPTLEVIGCDMSMKLLGLCRERKLEVARCDCMNLPFRSDIFDAAISIAVIHHLSTHSRRLEAMKELARITRPGGTILVYVWSRKQKVKGSAGYTRGDVLIPWHLQKRYQEKGSLETSESLGSDTAAGKGDARYSEEDGMVSRAVQTSEPQLPESLRRPLLSCGTEISIKVEIDSDEAEKRKRKRVEAPGATQDRRVQTKACRNNEIAFHRYYHLFEDGELEELCSDINDIVEIVESGLAKDNCYVIMKKKLSSIR